MERRPEPELMDSEAQTRAYAEADFSDSNQLFTDQFLATYPGLAPEGRAVDLGCGPADICIRVCRRLPGWHITGLDAGENMLQRAREAIDAAGLAERIELRLARLPDPGLGRQGYDAIISNSLLHHLPDPGTLWSSAVQLARPGAAVMVMDLERPGSEGAARALLDRYADGAPDILREDFYNSLLAAYTVTEVSAQLERAGLSHFRVSRPSDRHWLAWGRVGS